MNQTFNNLTDLEGQNEILSWPKRRGANRYLELSVGPLKKYITGGGVTRNRSCLTKFVT